jgi:hypothetical protein
MRFHAMFFLDVSRNLCVVHLFFSSTIEQLRNIRCRMYPSTRFARIVAAFSIRVPVEPRNGGGSARKR